ncbi:MAG TPA: ATP-binding protein [Candidatus Acidoferrales bacterium]|jgi:signal transduction histidine kinase/CheY-like chemotaxis protein|nr:ATP-binding protein [Candidatus Acidoferrales bacterium]
MNLRTSPVDAAHADQDFPRQQILAAQVRLLYRNANVGVGVTLVATPILGRLQWGVSPHRVIFGWCLYMFLVSVARFTLTRRYVRVAPSTLKTSTWSAAFAVGAGLAGAGWGAAGVLLYPRAQLTNQVFLIFILGGMMLGAASLLAPRPEAFLAFIVPTGLVPAMRLVVRGDEAHRAMGLLAGIFTLATLITTSRIHLTIASSLKLQFENHDLMEGLQAAKNDAEALNAQLEVRVRERTAELQRTTEQLRAEISQREQMEEELLRARKLESLGVLAGGIAHDFNNFLTVVQGNLELAKMQLDSDAPVQAILDQTGNACQRAVFLSSQLLTFAKGGAPIRRLVSVAKLVMGAVTLARAGAQTSIEVSIPENLWFAEVDPGQIGQVLHNILLNARQAMPEGGIIEVHAENVLIGDAPGADARVRISILDYGCGIPADVLPRIFDPYFTTKTDGSGLGLATAYAIIAKHGGKLSVKSNPGKGAIFIIDLPASQERLASQAPIAASPQTGTERLLVMDDEAGLRKLLEIGLSKLGYEVRTARDGAEAIALCEDAKAAGRGFDAVILDLTVSGGMGGMEAAARLKEFDPSLKLIVSSGYSDAPAMADFRRYGFDDVVPKPWTIAEVSEAFRRVLVREPDHKAADPA